MEKTSITVCSIEKQNLDKIDESTQSSQGDTSSTARSNEVTSGKTESDDHDKKASHWYRKAKDNKVVGLGNIALGGKKDANTYNTALSFIEVRDDSILPQLSGKPAAESARGEAVDIEKGERKARDEVENRTFIVTALDAIAALKVFLFYLITLNTIISVTLSVGLTVLWYIQHKESDYFVGGGMDWVLLGFAVVTPLSVSIGISFRRREFALLHIARVRSYMYQIYIAHATWGWGENNEGRSKAGINSLKHSDLALRELIGMGDDLCRFLSLPTSTKTRHQLTKRGREEATRTIEVAHILFESVCTERMLHLSSLCEILKGGGTTSSESARIRQFERYLGECFEQLRMVKMYRTPQALRAFGRIYTLFLPAFYAPSFAQLAIDLNSLAIGIVFAIIAPFALCALFESVDVLEDPFVAYVTLDGINVREEFMVLHWKQLITARERIFPNSHPFTRNSTGLDEFEDNSIPPLPPPPPPILAQGKWANT